MLDAQLFLFIHQGVHLFVESQKVVIYFILVLLVIASSHTAESKSLPQVVHFHLAVFRALN